MMNESRVSLIVDVISNICWKGQLFKVNLTIFEGSIQ